MLGACVDTPQYPSKPSVGWSAAEVRAACPRSCGACGSSLEGPYVPDASYEPGAGDASERPVQSYAGCAAAECANITSAFAGQRYWPCCAGPKEGGEATGGGTGAATASGTETAVCSSSRRCACLRSTRE